MLVERDGLWAVHVDYNVRPATRCLWLGWEALDQNFPTSVMEEGYFQLFQQIYRKIGLSSRSQIKISQEEAMESPLASKAKAPAKNYSRRSYLQSCFVHRDHHCTPLLASSLSSWPQLLNFCLPQLSSSFSTAAWWLFLLFFMSLTRPTVNFSFHRGLGSL